MNAQADDYRAFYMCPACAVPHLHADEPASCPLRDSGALLKGDDTYEDRATPHRQLGLGVLVAERYVLESVLGEGGMGIVYQAKDLHTGRRVALKTLRGVFEPHSSSAKRFLREGQLMARFAHPGVVRVIDFGTDDVTAFLVLELLEGSTLQERLDERIALDVVDACDVLVQLLEVLSVVHGQGVVHRDLKPANIFLCESDEGVRVRLLDFGLSKETRANAVKLTRPGAVLGTPYYMSPELVRGAAPSARTDLYALGVVFYQMLTGELPVDFADHGSFVELLTQVVRAARTPVLQRRPSLPPDLAAVVDRAVTWEANAFESAAAFRSQLMRWAPR